MNQENYGPTERSAYFIPLSTVLFIRRYVEISFNTFILTEWLVVHKILFTQMFTLYGKEPRMPQSVKSLATGWKPSIRLSVGANIFLFTTLCSPLIPLSIVYHWLFLQE